MQLNVEKKKKHQTTYKPIVIPMLAAIVLLSLVFLNYLQKELKLPTDDWSRSIELPNNSGNDTPFLQHKDGHTFVYTAGQTGIQKLELDEDLHVVNTTKSKAVLDENARVWSDGKQFVSTSAQKLVLLKEGKEKVLAENVSFMAPAKNMVYYSSENRVFAYLPEKEKTVEVNTYNAPISSLSGSLHHDSVMATVTADDNHTVHYATKTEDSFRLSPVFSIQKISTESLIGVKFAESDKDLHVIYTKYSVAGGARTYISFYGSAPVEKLENMPFNRLSFTNNQDLVLDKPTQMDIFMKGETPNLLFASRGMLTSKKDSVNIYTAQPENSEWKAERISSRDTYNRSPATLDGKNIFWLGSMSAKGNQLFAASSSPLVKEESKQITRTDLINAASNTIPAFIISFFAILVAMVWVLPTVLLLLVVYLFKKQSFEDEKPWIFWSFALLFAAAQTIGIQRLFNDFFYDAAPSYLTFTCSSYVIPVVIAGLALLALRAAAGKDWTLLHKSSFFTGMNLLIVMLLVGVYVY
ncbi:hypothetical protein ACFQPF_09340 [Fictibacillus iocasae]|uniref:Yip1 domain-containing protein n=1 Tax=Fictibacillus iocasae TaxID=2715437 RepID=A0ABW2NTB9_9BACL